MTCLMIMANIRDTHRLYCAWLAFKHLVRCVLSLPHAALEHLTKSDAFSSVNDPVNKSNLVVCVIAAVIIQAGKLVGFTDKFEPMFT